MVPIGYRPIIWHLMKYYAHYGYQDFVFCLGYRGDLIKQYFRSYDETLSNDFVLSQGGSVVELLNQDIASWRLTFVDTGAHSNVGQRLYAARPFVAGEEYFLANYTDGLTDADLHAYVEHFKRSGKVASFISVRPGSSFHIVSACEDGRVEAVRGVDETDLWINGGFFIFRQDIFDDLKPGEELVYQPFQRLIDEGQLITQRHRGFFMAMDTFKERQQLQERYESGDMPWAIWRNQAVR
jgi:glucose-1-phosphate cytidylyltransferase